MPIALELNQFSWNVAFEGKGGPSPTKTEGKNYGDPIVVQRFYLSVDSNSHLVEQVIIILL